MTGIPSVNKIYLIYQLLTLAFICLFAIYDKRHHKIRNTALLIFLPWCLLSIPLNICFLPAVPWPYIVLRSILGCANGFFSLLFVSMITDGGIGGGDIKFVGLLGIIYGTTGLIHILFLSCLIALLHNGIKKICHKLTQRNIPFAPYLFYGCTLYMIFFQNY